MFLLHFSRFKTFVLDIQKLKYAAAYFAYTQARPCIRTVILVRLEIVDYFHDKNNSVFPHVVGQDSRQDNQHEKGCGTYTDHPEVPRHLTNLYFCKEKSLRWRRFQKIIYEKFTCTNINGHFVKETDTSGYTSHTESRVRCGT